MKSTILEVKLYVTMCVLKAMQRLEHAGRVDAEMLVHGRGIRGGVKEVGSG